MTTMFYFFVFSSIFIFLSQENNQAQSRSRLEVADHLCTTAMGESRR